MWELQRLRLKPTGSVPWTRRAAGQQVAERGLCLALQLLNSQKGVPRYALWGVSQEELKLVAAFVNLTYAAEL